MMQSTLFDRPSIPLCEPRPDPDLCFNKHGGAQTSIRAHKRVQKSKDRALIYGYIKEAGAYGKTLDELSVLLDRGANCLSGRLTELRRAGEIIATDFTRFTRTRSRARVYVVTR